MHDEKQKGVASAVSVVSLVKSYGDKTVLKSIDLEIETGKVFGVLGPNGAGKTTLLETIAGLRGTSSGSVSVLGFDPLRDRKQLTAVVSVQPQSTGVIGVLTVLETLRLYASFHKQYRDVQQTLNDIGLLEHENVRVQNLSGGQLRRLLIGVAIIGKPRLVILDEPSAGLDPEARQRLLSLIRSLKSDGMTVIFSTHDMVEATQICDRVVIIAGGKIHADGSPERLIEEAGGTSHILFDVASTESLDRVKTLLDAKNLTWTDDALGFHVSYETADPDHDLMLLTRDRVVKGRRYRVERETLEDLYLAIVQESRATEEKVKTLA